MDGRFALIHSPFVGAGCWWAVAERLAARGVPADTPDCAVGIEAEPYRAAAERIASQVGDDANRTVLVVHSGAGGLAPAIAAALARPPAAIVFVDAILPHPGRSWAETAPPGLAERLRAAGRAGRAPPWHAWFGPETVARLVADPARRAAFVAEVPAAPLSFLDAPAPAEDGWRRARLGYLRLSEAYGPEADEAARLGWTKAHLALHHLAMITAPEPVSTALLGMASALAAA